MQIRTIMISKNHVLGDLQLIPTSGSKNMYDHDQHQQHLEDEGLMEHLKEFKEFEIWSPADGSLPVSKESF